MQLKDRPEQAANPDVLRLNIDQGKGADKVNHPDPAAAPLGTDDEAAGTPISNAQLHAALVAETRTHADSTDVGSR